MYLCCLLNSYVSFSVSFDLEIKANLIDKVAYEVHHSGAVTFFLQRKKIILIKTAKINYFIHAIDNFLRM